MSIKNSLENKKRRRVAKSITIGLPAYINLIEYVKDRTRCTTGTATAVLLSGAIKVDSHTVGYKTVGGKKVLQPLLPAEMRDRIMITKIGKE